MSSRVQDVSNDLAKSKTCKQSNPSPAMSMVTTLVLSGPPTSATSALLSSVASKLSKGPCKSYPLKKGHRPPQHLLFCQCLQQIVQRAASKLSKGPSATSACCQSSPANCPKGPANQTPQKISVASKLCKGPCKSDPAKNPALLSSVASKLSKGPCKSDPLKKGHRPPQHLLCCQVSPANCPKGRPQIVQRALQIRPRKKGRQQIVQRALQIRPRKKGHRPPQHLLCCQVSPANCPKGPANQTPQKIPDEKGQD